MEAEHPVDGLFLLLVDTGQVVGDVDPPQDQDPAVLLDLADRGGSECSVACIDASRL
jgi:hypothetical protein